MELFQASAIMATTAALLIVLSSFLKEFVAKKKLFYPLIIVLPVFAAGFTLRLAENNALVDLGFYFTEVSHLFIYILFTAALILGQKKYWGIEDDAAKDRRDADTGNGH